MRQLGLMVMACVVLVAVVRAEDKAASNDQEKIQGTWVMVSGERGGKPIPEEQVKNATAVFAGNNITIKHGDQEIKMTFKLDPTKKPKTIDVNMEGKTGKGIYELDGDTLKVAHGELDDPRPKEFSTKEGSNVTFVVFKRKKS